MASGSSSRSSDAPALRGGRRGGTGGLLAGRIASLRFRLEALGGLRALLQLPPEADLTARQWSVIDAQLGAARARLTGQLERASRAHLPSAAGAGPRAAPAARELNAAVGQLELELAKAYVLFDTYMDVLTQRASPELGPLLRGCDAVARDALDRDHPALQLVERPVVSCDRGFGAAIMRAGVPLPDGSVNPLPLIQLPYARLREKHNLTSLLHEAGHEALVRLKLRGALAAAAHAGLDAAGAPRLLCELFATWMGELGPDFWGFCCSGVAQPGSVREVLALPPAQAFRIAGLDPHPPPWLRVLFAFECARQQFGRGVWDDWEGAWDALYPLAHAPAPARALLGRARAQLPRVARLLFRTRFAVLGGRRLPELFDLDALSPARRPRGGWERPPPPGRPAAQLAHFRWLREEVGGPEEVQDRAMTRWLLALGTGGRGDQGAKGGRSSTPRRDVAHA